MKKSTVKAAKSPEPAKKVVAKIVKKPAAAPAKRTAAPAVKATPAKAAPTVITALVDVGFGNTLYIRGEGAGLSWDTGVVLDCVADDKWSISLPGSGKTVVYKLLINDLTWSAGADFIVEAGKKASVTPSF